MFLRSPLAHLLALLLTSTALLAQSSVWKVTRGSSTLYLGGTCHVLRSTDLPLPPEFDQAFAASSTLYFETDVARIQSPETGQTIMAEGMFLEGRTLKSALSPEAWKAAQEYSRKSGLPLEQLGMMKPWLFTITIAMLEIQKLGISTEGVDMIYSRKAKEAGKKLGELEPFEQHLKFITHLGAGHESEMVLNSIEELSELPTVLNAILAAWKTGDVAKIDELMLGDMRTKYPTIYQDLIVSRNDAWLPIIDKLAQTPEVEFILAGAAHMAGKDGLLERLRAKGYTVTQLNAPAQKSPKK